MFEEIKEFKGLIDSDIQPALDELEKIEIDASRKHLQKLVYTNLVDRFDYALDKTLIHLLGVNEQFQDEIAKGLKDAVSEGDLFKMLLSGKDFSEVRQTALGKINTALSATVLRSRHSKKLEKLLKTLGVNQDEYWTPRVNRATGNICGKMSVQDNRVPLSILGYADWLYSRRNGLVHGGGKKVMFKDDIKYLQEKFNWKATGTVRISLPSIKNAANFYVDLTEMVSKKIK